MHVSLSHLLVRQCPELTDAGGDVGKISGGVPLAQGEHLPNTPDKIFFRWLLEKRNAGKLPPHDAHCNSLVVFSAAIAAYLARPVLESKFYSLVS